MTIRAIFPVFSLAFPEFRGRIRIDTATRMFCANDIVSMMTSKSLAHASGTIRKIKEDHPEFTGKIQSGKIDNKGRLLHLVNRDTAITLALYVAKGKLKLQIVAYFAEIEKQFWRSEVNPLDPQVYKNIKKRKYELNAMVEEEAHYTQKQTRHNDARDSIAILLSGITEAECGTKMNERCDVLTETHAIEVKPRHQWKQGLGQAIVYARFTKTLPVLCIIDERLRAEEETICTAVGVQVWYFIDNSLVKK